MGMVIDDGYPYVEGLPELLPIISSPYPPIHMEIDDGYPYAPNISELHSLWSDPMPIGWMKIDDEYPYSTGTPLGDFDPPYPYIVWLVKQGELPYKQTWSEVTLEDGEPEQYTKDLAKYIRESWYCETGSLPYKQTWSYPDKFDYPTAISAETISHCVLTIPLNCFKYKIKKKVRAQEMFIFSFDGTDAYAYKSMTDQLVLSSKDTATTFWFKTPSKLSNSTITIDLGKIDSLEGKNVIRLALSDTLPTNYNVLFTQSATELEDHMTFDFTPSVTGNKYIGLNISDTIAYINSISIDGTKIWGK